jgi:hypothetical protein
MFLAGRFSEYTSAAVRGWLVTDREIRLISRREGMYNTVVQQAFGRTEHILIPISGRFI